MLSEFCMIVCLAMSPDTTWVKNDASQEFNEISIAKIFVNQASIIT